MTTNDKHNLAAAAIVATVALIAFVGWNAFADNARADAADAARADAAYLACMSERLGAVSVEDLDPRVKKIIVRECSKRV